MKKLFLLLLLVLQFNLSAQEYRGDYQEWSLEFNVGVNKPFNTMSSGYFTTSPSFYHVDLGTRYTFNPYIGIKADLGYDKFKNSKDSQEFETNYTRFNIQAVTDVGYALGLYNRAERVGILFHAGAGVSQFKNDSNNRKDKLINVIYGLTTTLKISNNVSLSGDISSLMHAKQILNFDGTSETASQSGLKNNLLNSSVGLIYFFRK
ncbi:outer membrane beta-barrel protein [Flavobacterium sp.]|uniref:outer membrane beta-barrel protein n=1 Tax=Flavobacterium sp. TaxID=239 RepID=UPI0026385EB8|nr:outer membrane beta-barrel protein [Flavobacterium sp.]MDG2430901.1 outer membrane beta-barrel protein [Flavobacterium sp.]